MTSAAEAIFRVAEPQNGIVPAPACVYIYVFSKCERAPAAENKRGDTNRNQRA